MRILSLLSSVAPFVLCNLMAPEGAQGGGSSSSAKPEQPTGNTLEERLSSATTIIGDYFTQLSGAMSERDQAITSLATITAERDGAVQARDTFKRERDEATAQLSTMTSARDGEKQRADKAEGRVTLVESFARGHGLDLTGIERTQAAKDIPGAGPDTATEGKALYDQWQALKKDPKNARKATAFFRKHKAELQEYADSLG
jgi:DNA repair ATPase RecN